MGQDGGLTGVPWRHRERRKEVVCSALVQSAMKGAGGGKIKQGRAGSPCTGQTDGNFLSWRKGNGSGGYWAEKECA